MDKFLSSLVASGEIFGETWKTLDDVIAANRLGVAYAGVTNINKRFNIEKQLICQVVGLSPKQFELRRRDGRFDARESNFMIRLGHICHLASGAAQDPGAWLHQIDPELEFTPIEAIEYEASYLYVVSKLLEKYTPLAPARAARKAAKKP